MEKEILNDLRSRIEDLQSQLDAIRARLDSALSEPEDAPFTEPVDISLDDPFVEESVPEAAGGTACATEGQLTQETGPSAAAGSSEAKEEEMPVESPKREVTLDYQWTKDIPGGPVSNIISGISLNDRVLLINTLFKEDPLLFQATIGDFNKMECFADACDYVQEHFPDWNLSSETVYRLMMAVRRKLK